MRTEDFARLLAAGEGVVQPAGAARPFTLALIGGGAMTLVLLALFLGFNPELPAMAGVPMFWVKAAFAAALVAGGASATMRLARPGGRLAPAVAFLCAPLVVMWLLAAMALADASPERRVELVFGETWTACLLNIGLLAVPVFAAVTLAVRQFAPTRLRLAGAAAGWLAGAAGALVYTVHCPELAAPFLGLWYVAGIAIPTVVGAALGPVLFRW